MTVKEIVSLYLISHGYDGLFQEGECACLGDDLAPCDEMKPDCEVGFKVPCDCGDHDYHIAAEKDPGDDTSPGCDGLELLFEGPLPDSLRQG